jgi:hypothetical protein
MASQALSRVECEACAGASLPPGVPLRCGTLFALGRATIGILSGSLAFDRVRPQRTWRKLSPDQ